MNKQQADLLNGQIRAAIRPFLEAQGMTLKSCNARFDDSTFNVSIKSVDTSAPISKWDLQGVGLPDDTPVGTPFRYNGSEWKFTGVNLRAQKFPIIAERFDGKAFKLPMSAADSIRKALEDA